MLCDRNSSEVIGQIAFIFGRVIGSWCGVDYVIRHFDSTIFFRCGTLMFSCIFNIIMHFEYNSSEVVGPIAFIFDTMIGNFM